MSRTALSLSIVTLFVLGTGAARAETAQVSVKIAELRAKPSSDARSKLKLGRNRSVDVLSKSDDGQWVKIRAEVLRGDEPLNFEGWVAAAHLGMKGASEPVSSSGSSESSSDLDWATETPAPAAAPAESWETPAASTDSPSESPSVDAWGDGGSDAPSGSDSAPAADDPESDW